MLSLKIPTLKNLATTCAVLHAIALPTFAAGPGSTNDFNGKRVLFIGIDGCRPDALQAASTPNIDALIAEGVITYNAIAGGHLGTTTQQVTYSGPGWASLLTGTWTNKHGVTNNSFSGNDFQNYPHFFRRLKESVPTAYVSSIINWSPIDSSIVEGSKVNGVEYTDFRANESSDAAVASTAATNIANTNPDAVFVHFDDVDHAGHAHGYSTAVPDYITSIEDTDTHIGTIINAIKARPDYAQEDWVIIVSTDHGGIGSGHGGQSTDERTIFMLVSGGATQNGVTSIATPGQPAVPATALKHLGVAVEPAWGWEENAFGFPAPTFTAEKVGNHAILSWTLPTVEIANLTGFEILRNGTSIATPSLQKRTFTDAIPSVNTTYTYTLQFTGSSESSLLKTLTFSTPNTTSDLILHLPFDGNADDATLNAHNATPVGTPTYTQGIKGQAATLDSSRHFTIPQTGNLRFGSTTDFTIGFWVKTTGQWSSDPSFISNKNWASGNNQGWIIAAQQGGTAWQWNLKGDINGRRDFDNGSTIQDETWHHILVSHDRDGNASFYQDGKLLGSITIANDGDTDTSFPIVIGRDGNLQYPFDQTIYIDDLKIWARVLTPTDITQEVSPVLAFTNWQNNNFTTPQLADPQISGETADPDQDGINNTLEFATGRDPNTPDVNGILNIETSGTDIIVSWPQRNNGYGETATTYTADGISYLIEHSTTLGNDWNSGPTIMTEHAPPAYLMPGWHTAKAKLTTQPETPTTPGFFRLNTQR